MATGIIDLIGSNLVRVGLPLVAAYFTLEALLLAKAIASKRFPALKGGPWLLIGAVMILMLVVLPLMTMDLFLMAVCWSFLIAAFVVAFLTSLDDMAIGYDGVVRLMKAPGSGGGLGMASKQYGVASNVIYGVLGLVSFREGSWLVWVRGLALLLFALMALFLAVVKLFNLH